MEYRSVLSLPLKTFWMLNRVIGSLRAEEDLRLLRVGVAVASQSGESCKNLHEDLGREIGSPVVIEKPFNEDAFLELQNRIAQGRRVEDETHKVE